MAMLHDVILENGTLSFCLGDSKVKLSNAYLQNGSRADPLQRLVPDCQTFADAPRDIRMDPAHTAAAGIVFETTKQGLCAALENAL